MLRAGRTSAGVRPWVALVAAYALAFQVLLSGFAASRVQAADGAAADLFVICHGDGSSSNDGGSGPAKSAQPSCMLCTLAKGAHAILPLAHAISALDARSDALVALPGGERIIQYESPTGRYSRGPPVDEFRAG